MEFTLRIEGYLAKDATHRTFDDGNAVTNVRVMHTKRYPDPATGAWIDGKTISLDVAFWRELAADAVNLKKGTKVLIECSDVDSRAYQGRGYTQATAKKITIISSKADRTRERDEDAAYARLQDERSRTANERIDA